MTRRNSSRGLARANGLTLDQAGHYMARIGDTPELAAVGRAIVRHDAGRKIARLIWE